MRKPNKREIILIGLMVGAIGFTMSLDANVKRKKRQNSKLRSQNRAQVSELAKTPVKVPGYVPGTMKAGTVADTWGLDPFDRAFTREVTGENDVPVSVSDGRIELDGVMIGNRGAAAIINKTVYRVGDTVDRYVVDVITQREVKLRSLVDGTVTRLKVE